MDKFIKIIEFGVSVFFAYPRWAQGLFILTVGLGIVSLGTFLVLLPSAKSKLDVESGVSKPSASFSISAPVSGAFLTAQRLILHGQGTDPKQDNSLKVKLLHVGSGNARTVQGQLIVNSDRTWRFEFVEFSEVGAYDLVVDAIFGGTRFSKVVRVNYEPTSERDVGSPSAFDDKVDSFNVLILPFEVLEESKLRETRYGRAVEKRLVELKEEKALNFKVKYLEHEASPIGFQQATEIGRKHNANLVIWGDYYEKVHSDATQAAVKYSLVGISPPNVSITGKTPITEVQSLSLISQGYLQDNIDYILYWVLAIEKFSGQKYADALPLFVHVKDKFANYFKGVVSLKLDEKGASFSANLPALQLLYNLAYCYSVTGRYDEAIPYWSAILAGGTGNTQGSIMVWDTFAIAVSMKNENAIRICAFALLNRAIGYQQRGEYAAAKQDYERLVTEADHSQVVGNFFGPVEPFVKQQLQELEEEG